MLDTNLDALQDIANELAIVDAKELRELGRTAPAYLECRHLRLGGVHEAVFGRDGDHRRACGQGSPAFGFDGGCDRSASVHYMAEVVIAVADVGIRSKCNRTRRRRRMAELVRCRRGRVHVVQVLV